MPSTETTRNAFEKQATGEGTNVWGDNLNLRGGSDRMDQALDGWLVLSSDTTLVATTGSSVGAWNRLIKATAALTVTVRNVQKWYIIWASSGDVVVTNGASSVTVKSPNVALVITDGTTVTQGVFSDFGSTIPKSSGAPSVGAHLINKTYADALAFSTALPVQSGNAGKFVTTDGTDASWVDLAIADVADLQTTLDAKALDADVEKIADRASVAVIRSNSADKHVATDNAWDSLDIVTLTDGATITPDMSAFINAQVTLGGNRTIAAPTNTKVGQAGTIYFIQDGTGSRTASFNSAYKFANGQKTLSTTAGAVDSVHYKVRSSTYIECSLVRAPS